MKPIESSSAHHRWKLRASQTTTLSDATDSHLPANANAYNIFSLRVHPKYANGNAYAANASYNVNARNGFSSCFRNSQWFPIIALLALGCWIGFSQLYAEKLEALNHSIISMEKYDHQNDTLL